MNAARRARQREHERAAGKHTHADHRTIADPKHPGKRLNVRCLVCRPISKKITQAEGRDS